MAMAHPDYSDSWEEFKGKYGKEYSDADEEVKILVEYTTYTSNCNCVGIQTGCLETKC